MTTPTGKLGPHGYLWIEVDGVNYTAQDLAWTDVYGELPDGAIVNLNGDRTVIDSQSVKSAEKGGRASIRMGSMRAS